MHRFNPSCYSEGFMPLLLGERLNVLGPGVANSSVKHLLETLDVATLFKASDVADGMANCCISALWLRHDFLDQSHQISQSIDSCEGSYWHGIMHRREPDPCNAKYWFRKVGDHAVFPQLHRHASELAESMEHDAAADFLASQDAWSPDRFIDLCTQVRLGKSASEELCQQIQAREWELLFDYCYQRATT